MSCAVLKRAGDHPRLRARVTLVGCLGRGGTSLRVCGSRGVLPEMRCQRTPLGYCAPSGRRKAGRHCQHQSSVMRSLRHHQAGSERAAHHRRTRGTGGGGAGDARCQAVEQYSARRTSEMSYRTYVSLKSLRANHRGDGRGAAKVNQGASILSGQSFGVGLDE